jgi:exopolysaccharide biosynthesis polyprenyl glycosylphosphotransferase
VLKKQNILFRRLSMVTDVTVLIGAFILACYVGSPAGATTDIGICIWLLLVIIPAWFFLLLHFGFYSSLRTSSTSRVLASLVKIHIVGSTGTLSVIYFMEPTGLSRGLVSEFLVFSFFLLSMEKLLLKMILSYFRRQGYNFRNILIVGTGKRATDFIRLLENHAEWGQRIVGLLQLDDRPDSGAIAGYNVLGSMSNLAEISKNHTVDEVVFCMPPESIHQVEERFRDMREMGITVRIVLDFDATGDKWREGSHFPILTFYEALDASQLFLKRCLDIVGALVGLSITVLLFPCIALAIKLESPGSLLFCQERVGMNGRIFTCWKFRSMYVDAESKKRELVHLNEMKGAIFKIKDDPRITRFGAFLRKTSLDELPQFWNVLKGEMSLVGTRPPTPDEVEQYENWQRKRISIKPGMTGLWQANGRNRIQDFNEVVRFDIEYIDRWSIWLDIRLLFKTVWVVFSRQGAS